MEQLIGLTDLFSLHMLLLDTLPVGTKYLTLGHNFQHVVADTASFLPDLGVTDAPARNLLSYGL